MTIEFAVVLPLNNTPYTINKSATCAPWKRSFKGQSALEIHILTSPAHKKPAPSQVRPAEPHHLLTTTERKHAQQPNAIASTSSAPQIAKPATKTVPQDADLRWSFTPESEYTEVLNALSAHCHSPTELEQNHFIVKPYDPLDYANLRKCKRCRSEEMKANGGDCIFHSFKKNKWNPNRPYKCCKTEGKGCQTLPTHDFQLPLRASQHIDYRKTPAPSAEPKFRAVVLDCEMAGIASGAGEVILLCATDYVTGAVLLNRYVNPSEKITQMRSSIHGISTSTLTNAILQGQALSGWEGARSELWKYIDDKTILVGHALQNDLDGLRIIHPRVVDSGILARNEVGIPYLQGGLSTLCSELLNVEIRKNKGGIHDCLEDVLATREVVLFCTQNKEGFRIWGATKKAEQMRVNEEREIARKEKGIKKAEADKAKIQERIIYHDDEALS
ncbi:RNA exonuclease [Lachnellula occidentalis]|uniref:RNA exonuclease n=1 Tax=Lachnellula occidentalis TaxID=215460 RepID=A0A8H8UEL3_9HELO|nr:RNA exonuclease [Lachnellula occidentalis]